MTPFSEREPCETLTRLIIDKAIGRQADDSLIEALEAECKELQALELAGKAREMGCVLDHVEQALDAAMYVHTPNGTPFNSAQEQALVMSRKYASNLPLLVVDGPC